MKKTIKSLLAIAIAAFAFAACSDVPKPDSYNENAGQPTEDVGEATGTGTASDPFNIAAAVKVCIDAGATETTEKYYVKGIAMSESTADAQYGNVTFDMADNTDAKAKLKAYRVKGSDGNKLKEGYEIKAGDEIIIYGPLMNYSGTYENGNNTIIVSHNGKDTNGNPYVAPADPDQPKGTGEETNPFNVAAAVAKCTQTGETATTDKFYITGIADTDYTVDSNKNVTVNIVDKAGCMQKFTLYRVKAKDGKGIKEGYKINKGDVLVVYGPVVNYKGNTPETATGAYLVSVNGNEPEVDGGGGGGGEGTPVATFTNGDFETWVDGLPTGWKSACSASTATLAQSTDVHGGNFSCTITGDASKNVRLAYKELDLEAGTYTFSFWVKRTTTDVAQVRPGYVPVTEGTAGSYKYGDYATLGDGWQQVSYSFTLDAATTVCLVVMNPKASSYSSGKDVLIDDATLVKN